jgi:CRISPR-associated protein Cmr2
MKYLFLVNIGPVQDFIASARRTRDLHFGSWFLSELARAAAYEIVKHNELDSLIFPAPASEESLKPEDTFIVANKIIAWVQQSPETLGKSVREAVFARLHDIREKSYKGIHFQERMGQIAAAQVEDLVEYFWVALPFDGQDYQGTRKRLEALMAARKNTRDFAQVSWGASVPKSSIDGKLESVILEREYHLPGASEEERRKSIRWLYNNYRAGPAERLSGVDLLKRRGATAFDRSFPSTSHMATLPFLERLKVLKNRHLEQAQRAWDTYIEEVRNLAPPSQLEQEHIPRGYPPHPVLDRYEGSMLFGDRLVDVLYEPGVETDKNTNLQKAKNALNAFYKILDQQFKFLGFSTMRPNPYYAFLQADGDSMGALIDALAEAERGYERHRQLSQRLSSFTEIARGIVRRHRGALVYAGGDDVMAFLPLDTVLECASELARAFREALQEFSDQQAPSLSVGIAIAHHLDSLTRVRYLAKEAEGRAKSVPGKSALAITISKRSGEDYHVVGQWGNVDESLQRLVNFCLKDAIPEGTAYELRDLIQRLSVPTYHQHANAQTKQGDDQLAKVIQHDAFRIMQRKLYVPAGKFPKGQAQEIERLFKAQLGIEQEPTSQLGIEHIQPVPLNELVNMLIVAQVLADAKQLATPRKKEGS